MRIMAALAMLALGAPGVAAQAGPPAEVSKLAYFKGTWNLTGEESKGPMGPGGKTSGRETCDWFAGNFALVCHADLDTPSGKGKSMSIFTWNSAKKRYSMDGIDSFGADVSASAEVSGATWQWSSVPMIMPDGAYTIKYDVTQVSDREYIYTWQFSKDKGPWQPGGKGKATKE